MNAKRRPGPPTTADDIRGATTEAREVLADIRTERRRFREEREDLIAEISDRVNAAAIRLVIDRVTMVRDVASASYEQRMSDLWAGVQKVEQLHRWWLEQNKDEFMEMLSRKIAREVRKSTDKDDGEPTGRFKFVDGPDGQIVLAMEIRNEGEQPRPPAAPEGNGQRVPPAFKRAKP